MTQDQYGQGYVVRGEVVPDDETEESPAGQAGPMTQFQKVASALRGDGPEASASGSAGSGAAGSGAAGSGAAGSDAAATGTDSPNGTDSPDGSADQETRSDEVGAVRSPDAEDRDDWDNEDDTHPADTDAQDSSWDQADTASGPHEVTAPVAAVPADPVPADPVPAAPVPAAPVPGAPVPAAPVPGAPVPGAPVTAGKHAGAAAEPELRPGEADAGLGDFSDLTYGSLLPDAAEFRERWQQVQFRFADDPHGSVTEAADVIAQVAARLEAAIAERQRSLRGLWGDGTNADTETLRATLLMYRAFLDRLTGSEGSGTG